MTRHFLPPAREATAMSVLLIKAARCWREARDSGKAVQPSLFILLSRHGHDMLAPVFDSLMTLAEAVSGKRIVVGSGPDLSEDEHRLIGLFEGTGALARKSGLALSLQFAVRSLQILLVRTASISAIRLAA